MCVCNIYVIPLFEGKKQTTWEEKINAHLANRSREHVDNLLVRDCDNALPVDLDDSVSNPDASTFGDATAQQAADLRNSRQCRIFKMRPSHNLHSQGSDVNAECTKIFEIC